MNKDRRARIEKIKEALEDLRGQIEDLQSEERDAFDAMPESLQQSDRGQASEAAADALGKSADLTERAWQLGEGTLAETLAARRLAHDARLAARLAGLDASEARYRLLLDAHQLWPVDMDDEHGDHDHP